MYSYEDRIRAVEHYIKLGKRVRPTIRQLGYPTKNALKGWYREYEQRLDLPAGYAGREPKYSQAEKAAAVEHYLAHDRCIAATMRALGYPGRGTLTAWVREALPESRKAVVGSVGRRRYRIRWYNEKRIKISLGSLSPIEYRESLGLTA